MSGVQFFVASMLVVLLCFLPLWVDFKVPYAVENWLAKQIIHG